jgi:hypothetical protein
MALGTLVTLDPAEVAILSRLPSLVGSVGAQHDDPAEERLHPAAYVDDEDAAREFRRLVDKDLVEGRSEDLAVFTETLSDADDGVVLSEAHLECWLRVLGDARLTLAARRELLVDDETFAKASRRDPDVALIDYLGMLQQEIVEQLLATMGASR